MGWKEMLPIVAAVVLLAFAVVAFKAFTSPPVPDAPEDLSPAYFFITQSKHIAVNAGNETHVSSLYVNYSASKISEFSAEILLLREKPIRKVFLLDYPRVDSSGYESFESRLAENLALYRISVSNISMDDAVHLRNSILIIGTGAVPSKLMQDQAAKFMLESGNAIILLGSPKRMLKSDRSLEQIGDSFTEIVSGYPQFVQKNSLREGWATPEAAADEIYEIVLRNSWQRPVSSRKVRVPVGGSAENEETALFSAPFNQTGAYYMSVLLNAVPTNDSYAPIGGILDAAPCSRLNGTIFTSYNLYGNETIEFEYEIKQQLETPTHLSLYTEIAQGERNLSRQYLDDITLDRFWHSQSDITLNLTPGDYEFRIIDQSGTPYATAYLHAKSLEVRLLEVRDLRYRFAFYIDGQPVANERIVIWLDNSEASMSVPTMGDGSFSVPASLSTGDHFFNFNVSGRTLSVPYTNTKMSLTSRLTTYYGIAGIVIIVLVIATRRGITQSWSLIVDAPPPQKARLAKIKPSQLFRAMQLYTEDRRWTGVPLSVNDAFIAVKKYITLDGKPVMATESNILSILGQLAKKGQVLSYMDYYMPAVWLGTADYKRRCAARFLSDSLIEIGLTPELEPGCDFSVRSPLGKSCILIYDKQPPAEIARLSEKGNGVLLFMDEQELGAFSEKLLSPEPEWARIALNFWNNKLQLMVLSEFKNSFKA